MILENRSFNTPYIRFCAIFFALSIAFVAVVRDFSFDFIPAGINKILGLSHFMLSGPWIWIAFPLVIYLYRIDKQRGRELIGVSLATIALSAAFATSKATIPTVNPFWADPMLTRLDLIIFNGRHGFEWAHELGADFLNADGVATTYAKTWAALSLLFPMIVTASDSNLERRQRYLMVYAITWVFLGVVLAMVMSSAGPVFADAITGRTDFAALHPSLYAVGLEGSLIDQMQQFLWSEYTYDAGAQLAGTGISAFPSLHVAMAALWCLYICERSPYFAPLGITYLVLIWFLSIYTGYHYATDGLISTLLVAAINWLFLRRRSGTSQWASKQDFALS
ncbi:PAP2 superfamily protein [Pacificibacter maritimus]|uniref:PAP2 superfamily protein n=1 Tax=Pacificibacter maritimus TaxID=762213 RepID=A0A3N4UXC6_9RHOB|nr:phosphatase PAP2 family protein [Pacificibacter maritimus]RPE66260.1 PAP2 superfamily protein [Pacificibacter maritimus]